MNEHEIIVYCPKIDKRYEAQYSADGHLMCPACGEIVHENVKEGE